MGKEAKKEQKTPTLSVDAKNTEYRFLFALSILVILLVFLFYIPAMKGGFIWDDDDYVTKNENLKTWTGLKRIWFDIGATYQYYPMVHTSFWVEYHLWKHNAFGYHLVNILLHGLNAVVVFFILRKLGLSWAWLAALAFALHPVQVESVAWITERKNVLSGFFYLLSLFSYLHFTSPMEDDSNTGLKPDGKLKWNKNVRLWKYYILSLGFYICALFSKTVTSSLPVILLVIFWWKGKKIRWCDIALLVPFLIFGGIMGSITARMEKYQIGAMGAKWDWTFFERCLIAGKALWFYAGKLLVPHPLVFIYPRWRIDAAKALQYIYPAGILIVSGVLWIMRRKIGKGPLAAVLYFFITLFPAIGFFNVYPMLYSYVADHFQYLASIGMITLYTGLIAFGLKKIFGDKKRLQYMLAGILFLGLGGLTWRQGQMYKDIETLWRATISGNPKAWLAHNNLGTVLLDQGKIDEAIGHFNESIEINPQYEIAYYNLGYAQVKKGAHGESMKYYQKAIELNPKYTNAYINLGMAYDALGDYKQAILNYNKAKALKPESDVVYCCLGDACSSLGSLDESEGYYKKSLELNPNNVDTHYNLACLLFEKKEIEKSIHHFKEALRLDPDREAAHNNLGIIYTSMVETDKALEHYNAALRINPASAGTLNNMGLLSVKMGKTDEAISFYTRAIDMDPQNANCYINLGDALLSKGEESEGKEVLYKAHSLCPEDPWVANKLAWIQAASKKEGMRNAPEAVRLAELACRLTQNREPTILDTLAAAYAEAGRFEEALQTGKSALRRARQLKQEGLAKEIEARLDLFKTGKPFRE